MDRGGLCSAYVERTMVKDAFRKLLWVGPRRPKESWIRPCTLALAIPPTASVHRIPGAPELMMIRHGAFVIRDALVLEGKSARNSCSASTARVVWSIHAPRTARNTSVIRLPHWGDLLGQPAMGVPVGARSWGAPPHPRSASRCVLTTLVALLVTGCGKISAEVLECA